jgi:hypothetical protein
VIKPDVNGSCFSYLSLYQALRIYAIIEERGEKMGVLLPFENMTTPFTKT